MLQQNYFWYCADSENKEEGENWKEKERRLVWIIPPGGNSSLQLEHGQPTASTSQGRTRIRSRLMTCCISIVAQGSHCRSHCLPVRPMAPAAPQLRAGMVTSRTRSPPHDAHRKPTSVMPRSPLQMRDGAQGQACWRKKKPRHGWSQGTTAAWPHTAAGRPFG